MPSEAYAGGPVTYLVDTHFSLGKGISCGPLGFSFAEPGCFAFGIHRRTGAPEDTGPTLAGEAPEAPPPPPCACPGIGGGGGRSAGVTVGFHTCFPFGGCFGTLVHGSDVGAFG